MDKALVLAKELKTLRERVSAIVATPTPLDGKEGPQGPVGKQGEQGLQGVSGKDGKDGKAGKDGKDGENGEDGVSIVDAEVDIDGTLSIELSDGTVIKTATEVVGPRGPQGMQGPQGESFYQPINPVFSYTGGLLTNINYSAGEYKTLTYTSGVLTQVDFYNNTATIRKTLNYTEGVLTSITQTEI